MLRMLICSFFIAVLAGLGTGSGGLLVIYLTQIEGVGQLAAQGVNLLFFICSALVSVVLSFKSVKSLFKTVAVMSAAGAVGCLLGAHLAGAVNSELLQKIFGASLAAIGSISLFKQLFGRKKD